jgi:hypothetical protein
MDQNPLVNEQIDAGADFVSRFEKRLPVTVAFWLKTTDGGEWYLYVASEQVAAGNLDHGYSEVLTIAGEHPNPYLNPFRVKLIPATHPLAQAASEINHRFPGRVGARFGNRSFGGVSVEEAYIYPTEAAAPAP